MKRLKNFVEKQETRETLRDFWTIYSRFLFYILCYDDDSDDSDDDFFL